MISLEQWQVSIGEWHSGKLNLSSIYRRYGSRRCKGQTHLWFALSLPLQATLEACNGCLHCLGTSASPSKVQVLRLLLALCWLLIVAGDVELNPGPLTAASGKPLDDLIKDVPANCLDQPCKDHHLNEIALSITNWQLIAPFLGLNDVDEEEIHEKYNPLPRKAIAMLRRWKEKFGKEATCRILIHTFWKLKFISLIETFCSILILEHNKTFAQQGLSDSEKQPAMQSTLKKEPPDPRESHPLCGKFASAFRCISRLLDESVGVAELKDFLDYYSHPNYPEQKYINPKMYEDAKTTKELLKSLFPQFINYMNYYLLDEIIVAFKCTEAKPVLEEYKMTLKSSTRKRKLQDMPAPITDEKVEQLNGVKKIRVVISGNSDKATLQTVQEVQKALEFASGVKRTFIVYASQDPGSIILSFLLPVTVYHNKIFHELNEEDLAVLADIGVLRLEMDDLVIDSIQEHATKSTPDTQVEQIMNADSAKPTGLEYYLRERQHEVTFEEYKYLQQMIVSISSKDLEKVCSDDFLATFSGDLKEWKNLASYFGLNEQNVQDLQESYQKKHDQSYFALMCWKKHEGSAATYHNLLETLLLHGKIMDVKAVLHKIGPEPTVLQARKWLQQKYLELNSNDWEEILKLNQRLGLIKEDTTGLLRTADYSTCYETLDQFPGQVIAVSVKYLINAISHSRPTFLNGLGIEATKPVLIKALEGSGSSLLLKKLCHYWAEELGLRNFRLVLWLNLAMIHTLPDTLDGIIQAILPARYHVYSVISWIKRREGEGLLVIIDGWKKNHEECRNEFFSNILSRKILKKSTILVTSTFIPSDLPSCQKFVGLSTETIPEYTQFDLFGLTSSQITKQVIEYYTSDPLKAETFLLFLFQHPDVNKLASIPVYLYGMLSIFEFIPPSGAQPPMTWTKLFSIMTLLLLDPLFPDYEMQKHLLQYLDCFPHLLPETIRLTLDGLSRFAWKEVAAGTAMYSKPLLPETEQLMSVLPRLTSQKPIGIALLCTEHSPFSHEKSLRFTFPLLRDFLAAIYVHTLPLSTQEQLMRERQDLLFLWQFYAGLAASDQYHDRFLALQNIFSDDLKTLANFSYEFGQQTDSQIQVCVSNSVVSGCDVHHLFGINNSKMKFYKCDLGTAALVNLSKWNLYVPQPLQCQLFIKNCTLSYEGLPYLGGMPVQLLRLEGISTEVLCVLTKGLKRQWGLQGLDVSGNDIAPEGATALAKALPINKSLRKLNLNNNQIEDSGATALAESLYHNTSLQELCLNNNCIGDEGAIALAKVFNVHHSLKQLSLSANKIGTPGADALAEALNYNKSMEDLDLRKNAIGDVGATAMAKMLQVNCSLKKLILGSNAIGPPGAVTLSESLQLNKSLEELMLGSNHIGDEGAIALARVLQTNDFLKLLNLCDNEVGNPGARALARSLHHNRSLEELNLWMNRVSDEGATALARALQFTHSLSTLDLGCNRVGIPGVRAIADSLYLNKSLKELCLWGNNIGNEGVIALASPLQANHSLKKLDLGHNNIGTPMAASLCLNQTLEELDLSRNAIDNEGAVALAKALQTNQSLKILNLGKNIIGDRGATAFANLLHLNTSLEELDLSCNNVGDEGATVLVKSLQVNESINSLELWSKNISKSAEKSLGKMLAGRGNL